LLSATAQLLVTSKLRDNPAAMINMRCHIRVSLILNCLVIADHHCGRWRFWRVAVYATPENGYVAEPVRGRRRTIEERPVLRATTTEAMDHEQ